MKFLPGEYWGNFCGGCKLAMEELVVKQNQVEHSEEIVKNLTQVVLFVVCFCFYWGVIKWDLFWVGIKQAANVC